MFANMLSVIVADCEDEGQMEMESSSSSIAELLSRQFQCFIAVSSHP